MLKAYKKEEKLKIALKTKWSERSAKILRNFQKEKLSILAKSI